MRWPLLFILLPALALAQPIRPAGVRLADEGTVQSQVLELNCMGAGVTCTTVGTQGTLTVPAGAGGVTAVTASPPLASSGGLTPNLSVTGTVAEANGGTGAGALTCAAGQATTTNGTAYSCTSALTASDVVCAGTCVADAEISAVAGAKVTGTVASATSSTTATTASTAAALTANPVDCLANQYANAIAANGDLTCTQVATTQLSGTVTNAQLAGSYSGVGACSASQWASTLNANGVPTCTQPGFSNLTGTATLAQGGGLTTATDDAVAVGNGTALVSTVLPSCSAAASSKLLYNVTTNAFTCGADQGLTQAYATAQEEAVSVAQRSTINFVGPATTVTDVGGTTTTVTTVASGVGVCAANQWVFRLTDGAAPACAQVAFSDLSGVATLAQGGTGLTASTEDAVMVGSGTTAWQAKVIPACAVGLTSKLLYDQTTNAFSCGVDTDTDYWTLTGADLYRNSKVKIGAASAPTDQLEVITAANIYTASFFGNRTASGNGGPVKLQNSSNAGGVTMDFYDDTGTVKAVFGYANSGYAGIPSVRAVMFLNTGAGGLQIVNGATNYWIFNSTGAQFPDLTTQTTAYVSHEISLALGNNAMAGLSYYPVTGQTWVHAADRIICNAAPTTADGLTPELYLAADIHIFVDTPVAGTGFNVGLVNNYGAAGTFRFTCYGT